jgi:hypothetical protein
MPGIERIDFRAFVNLSIINWHKIRNAFAPP